MPSHLYDRVIHQLDGLLVFMGLRERSFFDRLNDDWGRLFDLSPGDVPPPATYEAYEQFVLQSSLLLGVSYAEAYFADALRAVLRREPRILATRNKNVTWEQVVKSGDLQSLVDSLIEKELLEFTHLAISGMLRYLAERLSVEGIDCKNLRDIEEASVVRNLITHNSAISDRELVSLNATFSVGTPIRLSTGLVHRYGLAGRSLIRRVDEQLVRKYGIAEGPPSDSA